MLRTKEASLSSAIDELERTADELYPRFGDGVS
jgi:hypothetical protein